MFTTDESAGLTVEQALRELRRMLPQHLAEIRTLSKSDGWRRIGIRVQGQPEFVAATLTEAMALVRAWKESQP